MLKSNVKFRCPHCGQVSEGATRYIGTESNCPRCGRKFRLTAVMNETSSQNPVMCYFGMFRRYFDFRGRARRREMWWALLFHTIVTFVVAFLLGMIFVDHYKQANEMLGYYGVATLLPFLAIQVRRLHDTNKSGWWVLLFFMPVLNIAYFVWLATDGDKGANRFGVDPKDRT